MSDLDVTTKYDGELIPFASFTGELEVIDFFPHPLEDSEGNTLIDSNGNSLNDWTPGPQADSFCGELVPLVEITGEIRGI